MQERKKKIVKQVKKARKKLKKQNTAIQQTTADPEIDQLVHKYVQQNASKNTTEDEYENSDRDLEDCLDEVDFSAPIEALVVNGDVTRSKLL